MRIKYLPFRGEKELWNRKWGHKLAMKHTEETATIFGWMFDYLSQEVGIEFHLGEKCSQSGNILGVDETTTVIPLTGCWLQSVLFSPYPFCLLSFHPYSSPLPVCLATGPPLYWLSTAGLQQLLCILSLSLMKMTGGQNTPKANVYSK